MSSEQERKIHVRLARDLHKRLRVRCAELALTIQDYVVDLLVGQLHDGQSSTSSLPAPQPPKNAQTARAAKKSAGSRP